MILGLGPVEIHESKKIYVKRFCSSGLEVLGQESNNLDARKLVDVEFVHPFFATQTLAKSFLNIKKSIQPPVRRRSMNPKKSTSSDFVHLGYPPPNTEDNPYEHGLEIFFKFRDVDISEMFFIYFSRIIGLGPRLLKSKTKNLRQLRLDCPSLTQRNKSA